MYNYFLHIRTALIIRRKHLLDWLSLRKNVNYTSFIILCEPRSGSTLLHTYLNSHPKILSYGEILRENSERKNPLKNILTAFVFKPHTPSLKAIGLKIFYEYLNDSRFKKDVEDLVARKNISVIHLIRQDQLKQYASLKIAEATNVWSTASDNNAGHTKIRIATEDYIRYRVESQKQRAFFMRTFQQHNILTITYEDLVLKKDDTLNKIQEFLKVPAKDLFTLLKKQNTNSLEKTISNYDELKSL